MTRSKKPPRGYTVGYGRPPLHSRFQHGKSGNPHGRPRRGTAERVRRLLQEELFRTISVRDGDDVLRLSAVKAVLRQTIRLALKGNSPAQRKVIDMVQAIGKASDGSFDPGAMSLEGLIIESYRKHEAVEHRQQTHSEVNSSGSHESSEP
jgi:hypothetical protein